jgi:hypothetical protein
MNLSDSASRAGMAPAAACTLRVEAVFRDLDEQHMQAVAAAMIDCAHELANRPECESDVDVSVQWGSPRELAGPEEPGGGPARGRSAER